MRKEYNRDDRPMMLCGHTANAKSPRGGTDYWACALCGCLDIMETPPVLTGRKARCSYYGQKINPVGSYHGCECDICKKQPDGICRCERESAQTLAFFEYKPNSEFDEFYCGCASWE